MIIQLGMINHGRRLEKELSMRQILHIQNSCGMPDYTRKKSTISFGTLKN